MSRRPSKGKGKRLPSPTSSEEEDRDFIKDRGGPPKKPRVSSPRRVKDTAAKKLAKKSATSSSKGMVGFASLLNRSNLSAAQEETSRGLKGGSSGQHSRTTSGSKAAKNEVEHFTVGTIVFFVVGVIENVIDDPDDPSLFPPAYCLQSDVDASPTGLTGMKHTGLCVMKDTGFDFLSTDTYAILDNKFQALFPKLFDWLAQDDPQGTATSWLICMKPPYKRNVIVYSNDASLPNGFEIIKSCSMSKPKAGAQDRILYLVTRNPVPPEVLRSWRPKPICPGITASGSYQTLDSDEINSPSEPEDTDDEVDTSSDPPPISSLLQFRRSLRHRSEEEVEHDIISIPDSDGSPSALVGTPVPVAGPAGPSHLDGVNDAFSSSINFSEDNPWV